MYGLVLAEETHFTIRKQDNVFLIHFSGYWDMEVMQVFKERLRLLIEILAESKWGALADLREWEGASDEVYGEAEKVLDWMVEHGQSAGVHVLNSGVKSRAITHLQEIQRGRIAFDVFHSIEVALPWLRAKLRQSSIS